MEESLPEFVRHSSNKQVVPVASRRVDRVTIRVVRERGLVEVEFPEEECREVTDIPPDTTMKQA